MPGPDARGAVLDQLRRAEYHRDDRSFLAQAWDWVTGTVHDLLDRLHGPAWSVGGWAFWLVVLAAVLAAGYALWRSGLPRRRARDRGRDPDPLAPEPDVDHRGLALRFAAEGRRADALREWLRAAVRSIEDRGVLAPRPGRTGAATAREAGPRLPDAARPLAEATRAFDEVWFGRRAATDADLEIARRAADLAASTRIVEPADEPDFAVPR